MSEIQVKKSDFSFFNKEEPETIVKKCEKVYISHLEAENTKCVNEVEIGTVYRSCYGDYIVVARTKKMMTLKTPEHYSIVEKQIKRKIGIRFKISDYIEGCHYKHYEKENHYCM